VLDLVLPRLGVSCRKELFRSTSSLICFEYADDRASGRDVGKAILFYGCHSKEADALYDTELTKWEKEGVVSLRHAFSRSPQESKGCKHVQYVFHSFLCDHADKTGIGYTTIEKTLLRFSKLVERSIFVDHLLLPRESRRLWSRFGARGKRRVRRLGGSGYRVWARRGLLPMSLSKGMEVVDYGILGRRH
jgi:hypothetical protein